MAKTIQNQYRPPHVTCPGEILAEALEERGMEQAQLAARMGRPEETISEIINGKAALTPETALQLERILNIPARFWNSLERNYRELQHSEEKMETIVVYVDDFGGRIPDSWLGVGGSPDDCWHRVEFQRVVVPEDSEE